MKRKRSRIRGQFAARLIEMLESPAYRVLSLTARKVLNRVEIEHAHHGGTDNGRLSVAYDDFVTYGIHPHSIRPAINELVALGFLEITRDGSASKAEWRQPNLFRLTYRHDDSIRGDGTHEWRNIKTEKEAGKLAKTARAAKSKTQCRKADCTSDENPDRKSETHSAETVTTALSPISVTTLDTSGRVAKSENSRDRAYHKAP